MVKYGKITARREVMDQKGALNKQEPIKRVSKQRADGQIGAGR